MHDPMVVAFDIRRPWPRRSRSYDTRPGGRRWAIRYHHECDDDCRTEHAGQSFFPWWKPSSYSAFWTIAGRGFYFPSMITVWHVEPDDWDSGEVCKHYRRVQREDGTWHTVITNGWRWHVHHWRIQVPPLQGLRRRLLTRCAWCGGRHRKGDAVNVSNSWHDGPRGPWWRGETDLLHRDCANIQRAHWLCLCDQAPDRPLSATYGRCADCGKARWHNPDDADALTKVRAMAAIPEGRRA